MYITNFITYHAHNDFVTILLALVWVQPAYKVIYLPSEISLQIKD